MLVMMMLVMVVSSRKCGSLRLRGLRILGADRCASGRTLGGTEPVIRKSGNWCSCCSTLLPPTLLLLHFPRVSELRMPTPEPLDGPGCTRVMCIRGRPASPRLTLSLGIVGARSWGAALRCARLYVDGRPSGQADSQGGPASVTTVIGPHLLCTVSGREEAWALGRLYLLSIS